MEDCNYFLSMDLHIKCVLSEPIYFGEKKTTKNKGAEKNRIKLPDAARQKQ